MAGLFSVILTLLALTPCCQCRDSQQYSEQLFLKQLFDGRVSATFQFSTVWGVHPFSLSRPENGELWTVLARASSVRCASYPVT